MAEVTRIQLDKISDISKAEQLHEKLEALLNGGTAVDIDASLVERVDTAILQLLTSFVRTIGKQHLAARIVQPSARFSETVRLMGLGNALNLQH